MSKLTGSVRPLEYPLFYNADIESQTPDEPLKYTDLSQWQTTDSDERINIVVKLSLNEYVSIASAIDAGRDIAYGDNSIELWWLWTRILESMTICEDVANCIETSESVQSALAQFLTLNQGNGLGTPLGVPTSTSSAEMNPDSICDADNAFAFATQITDLTNKFVTDLYESIEATTYLGEVLAVVIGAVPILDQLAVDNIVSLVENFISQAGTAYAGAYTETVRNEIRCDIFCIIMDNGCDITWAQLATYFADMAIQEYMDLNLLDLMEFLTQGVFSGVEYVYASNWFFWGCLSLMSRWFETSFNAMRRIAQALWNDSDPDWETLCEDCPQSWTWVSDFNNSENIWVASDNGFGAMSLWTSGTGWSSQDRQNGASNYGRFCSIQTPEFTPTEIISITVNYTLTRGTFTNPSVTAFSVNAVDNDNTSHIVNVPFSALSNGTFDYVHNVNQPDITLVGTYIRSSQRTTAIYDGACKINSVIVSGVGINPFD